MKQLFILLISFLTVSCSQENKEMISIVIAENANKIEQQIAGELREKLEKIYPTLSFSVANENNDGRTIYIGKVQNLPSEVVKGLDIPENEEGYLVKPINEASVVLTSKGSKGLIYGVYGLLEKLGYAYTLNDDILSNPKEEINFSTWDIANEPLADERILFTWHNFLSGCTGWDYEDWETWVNQSQKMGFNSLMIHLYPNNPIFDFEFNGYKKEVGLLSSSHKGRDWGTEHVNDVRRLPSGEVFSNPVFASEVAMVADSLRIEAVQKMMQRVFAHAEERGMDINLAYDFDLKFANPQEMVLSLPKESRFLIQNNGIGWMGAANAKEPIWLVRPDHPEGYNYYKTQVIRLLELYPQIDRLTLWKRFGNSPWTSIKKEELPTAWKQEFDSIATTEPAVLTMKEAPASFAQAKVMHAFRQILDEIGKEDIELGFGTWRWHTTESMNYFYPEGVSIYVLDSEVIRKKKDLHSPKLRAEIGSYLKKNKVRPIIWAHHDDGAQFGSSLESYENLADKLQEINTNSFGVLHWMTRPFDLWVLNHNKQVWSATKNQAFINTIEEQGTKWFDGANAIVMADYLKMRQNEMPHFGRETRRWFVDDVHFHQFDSIEVVIEGCQRRIEVLEKVEVENFSLKQLERYKYFLFQEQFVQQFYEQQGLYLAFEKAYNDENWEEAKAIANSYKTEETLATFADMIQQGTTTKGELGLLFSLGLRWHMHFISQQQRVGLRPIPLSFGTTQHEPQAQMPGRYTYLIDNDKTYWKVLGKKETNREVVKLTEEETVYKEGILLDEKVEVSLRTFTFPTLEDVPLMAGKYSLELILHTDTDKSDITIAVDGKTLEVIENEAVNPSAIVELNGASIPTATIHSKSKDAVIVGLIIEKIKEDN